MSYVVGGVLCSPAVRCRVIIMWDSLRGILCLKMGYGPLRSPKKLKEFDNATQNLTRAARVQKKRLITELVARSLISLPIATKKILKKRI